MDYFASSDNSNTSKEKYGCYVKEFSTLSKEVHEKANSNQHEFEKYDQATLRNFELKRENYMLKHYQNQNGSLISVTYSDNSPITTPAGNSTLAAPSHQMRRGKGSQYKRWFDEAILEGRILKAKNAVIGETIVDAHKIAIAENKRLEAEQKKILKKYSVQAIEWVPPPITSSAI